MRLTWLDIGQVIFWQSRGQLNAKKGRGKYSAILTEQAWSIMDLLYDQTNNFFLRDQRGVLQGSLSNDDGDGNKNDKIAVGLYLIIGN